MSWQATTSIVALVLVLIATVPPLGRYMAAVYGSRPDGSAPFDRFFGPIERTIYRLTGVDHRREQRWSAYARSLLAFSIVSLVVLYVMLRLQGSLVFNPTGRDGVGSFGALNIAISFVSNTNWQWYGGEMTLSHLSQMLGLTVQNFVSAAAGMAVAIAIIRGITRTGSRTLGNFWVDLTRTVTRILLPLSMVVALVLVSQGVIQNFRGSTTATTLDRLSGISEQLIPGGPAASQVAIKQLGTNGGGFFNVNSAHPFENANTISNFVQTWSILVVPFAFVVAFGYLVKDRRQSRLLIGVMAVLLVLATALAVFAEQNGNPELTMAGVDQSLSVTQSGGNMEGKEVRFGAAACGVWSASTTNTSNGSVNCMHGSMTPLGGTAPMVSMMFGEVSPGGVGVGLMGMLVFALLAVFIAGLMVGRTPEYLGKKIQAVEMKLLTLYILTMPIVLLSFAAASTLLKSARTFQDGPHGLSELLYNFASAANNNGSAFAYQGTGTDWYTITQGLAMLAGRFFLIIPALAIGGSLAAKPRVPATSGTMPTHNPLFGGLVVGVIVIVAGLTFFPALALGPILEHLSLS
ncbi:potassium-transporting ATPase subunit KdpA [Desertimonas flava]|uniref:potassium-transporting ATPase subunit KdpA n=1 Tax=Desertimonas flava TaxID=2064846 RepID=UPI000E351F64|nr:potassium-transporting ATPase subunit KdpA [Desertimonas flava]